MLMQLGNMKLFPMHMPMLALNWLTWVLVAVQNSTELSADSLLEYLPGQAFQMTLFCVSTALQPAAPKLAR